MMIPKFVHIDEALKEAAAATSQSTVFATMARNAAARNAAVRSAAGKSCICHTPPVDVGN